MTNEKEGVNTRTYYIQERRHLPFSNSIRAAYREEENNLHRALSNRGKREKKWIYQEKNLVELVKKKN